jgi:hypothetical protein
MQRLTFIGIATGFFMVACARQLPTWHDRLYAVDHGLISDSAIWAISADTLAVIAIEKSDSATRAIHRYDSIHAIVYESRWDTGDYFRGIDTVIRANGDTEISYPFGGRSSPAPKQ